jgi:hypothetical protein
MNPKPMQPQVFITPVSPYHDARRKLAGYGCSKQETPGRVSHHGWASRMRHMRQRPPVYRPDARCGRVSQRQEVVDLDRIMRAGSKPAIGLLCLRRTRRPSLYSRVPSDESMSVKQVALKLGKFREALGG